MGFRFGIHADAAVADCEHDVFAGRRGGMKAGITLIECDVGSFDGELAAMRHGVAGVDRQVHDDLLDLSWIGLDCAEIRAGSHDQINVLADDASEHFQIFADQRIQVENSRHQHLFAAEGEKLTGQSSGPVRSIGYFLSRRTQFFIFGNFFQQKF